MFMIRYDITVYNKRIYKTTTSKTIDSLASRLVDIVEVFERFLGIWLESLGARGPVGWAHFAVHVGELECLNETKSLVDTAANWQIVDGHLTQFLVAIDDVQATEWNARFFIQYVVVAGDAMRLIGQQWNVQAAQTTLFAWRVYPGQVGEVTVGGAGNHFATNFAELSDTVGERNNLGWAHESTANEEKEKGISFDCFVINCCSSES